MGYQTWGFDTTSLSKLFTHLMLFVFLPTATLPIRFIIASQRLNYLYNILSRKNDEVLKKVYLAQKQNPLEGDFVKLVENDFKLINMIYSQQLSI